MAAAFETAVWWVTAHNSAIKFIFRCDGTTYELEDRAKESTRAAFTSVLLGRQKRLRLTRCHTYTYIITMPSSHHHHHHPSSWSSWSSWSTSSSHHHHHHPSSWSWSSSSWSTSSSHHHHRVSLSAESAFNNVIIPGFTFAFYNN